MEDEDLKLLPPYPNQNDLHHRHVELGGTEAAWQPTKFHILTIQPAADLIAQESAAKHEVMGQLGEFATGT